MDTVPTADTAPPAPATPGVEPMITYRELAARTGIPTGTLAWWVRERRIPHVRLGARHVRFRWPEIQAWLDARVMPPLEPIASRGRP